MCIMPIAEYSLTCVMNMSFLSIYSQMKTPTQNFVYIRVNGMEHSL